MKVYVEALGENELARLLIKLYYRATECRHSLVNDPGNADMIVLCGSWTMEGLSSLVTAHGLVQRYPTKCVAYSDDDAYLPLLPGAYCSPRRGISTWMGRVRCYSYIARHVRKGNPFVAPLAEERSKELLFSFRGATTSFVRKRLFKIPFHRSDVLVEDTTFHQNWVQAEGRVERQKHYVETIARSHFVLCPCGGGSGSFRLFEVMEMGAAPVLISDRYVLPEGPLWSSFLIRVPENDISNLPAILERHRPESEMRGRSARQAWEQWFSTEQEFNQIISACESALSASARTEQIFRAFWPVMIANHYAKRWVRRKLRAFAFQVLRTLGLQPPYSVRDQPLLPFDAENAEDDLTPTNDRHT